MIQAASAVLRGTARLTLEVYKEKGADRQAIHPTLSAI
jgi:hypothetical protein